MSRQEKHHIVELKISSSSLQIKTNAGLLDAAAPSCLLSCKVKSSSAAVGGRKAAAIFTRCTFSLSSFKSWIMLITVIGHCFIELLSMNGNDCVLCELWPTSKRLLVQTKERSGRKSKYWTLERAFLLNGVGTCPDQIILGKQEVDEDSATISICSSA